MQTPSTETPRLAVKGIRKAYPAVVANDDVSLSVMPGEIHAVLGENGAGKSTLMKLIYGVAHPDAGEIIWRDDLGATCRRWNWRQCKRTAITGESTNLWFVIDRLPPMSIDDLQRAH